MFHQISQTLLIFMLGAGAFASNIPRDDKPGKWGSIALFSDPRWCKRPDQNTSEYQYANDPPNPENCITLRISDNMIGWNWGEAAGLDVFNDTNCQNRSHSYAAGKGLQCVQMDLPETKHWGSVKFLQTKSEVKIKPEVNPVKFEHASPGRIKPRQGKSAYQFPKLETTVLDSLVAYQDASCSGSPTYPQLEAMKFNCWNFESSTHSLGIIWQNGKPSGDARMNYRAYRDQDCVGKPIGPTFRSDYVEHGGWNQSAEVGACVPNSYFANNGSWASVEYSIPVRMEGGLG